MNLDLGDNLRQLAKVVLCVVNFLAWFEAIALVWLYRVQLTHGPRFEPPGLAMGAFVVALFINVGIVFAVRGLYARGAQRTGLLQ